MIIMVHYPDGSGSTFLTSIKEEESSSKHISVRKKTSSTGPRSALNMEQLDGNPMYALDRSMSDMQNNKNVNIYIK